MLVSVSRLFLSLGPILLAICLTKITHHVKYLYVPRAVCLAQLVLGSVTVCTVLVFSQPSRLNSPWPSLRGRANNLFQQESEHY